MRSTVGYNGESIAAVQGNENEVDIEEQLKAYGSVQSMATTTNALGAPAAFADGSGSGSATASYT